MKPTFLKGVALGAIVSVVTLMSSAALAGTGIGGIFNLGKANSVNATSNLAGTTAGPQLQVTNHSNGSSATGVRIKVPANVPPLSVNSSTQVPNLNSSYLGGKPAGAFLPANGTAADASALGGFGASDYLKGDQLASVHVQSDGTTTSGPGSPVDVVHEATGIYCVSVNDFLPTGGSVTLDSSDPGFPVAYMSTNQGALDSSCGRLAGGNVLVETFLNGQLHDDAFYGVFF